jgi:hypothetical protein
MSSWVKPGGIVLRIVSGKKEMTFVSGSLADSMSLIGWRWGAWGGRVKDLVDAFGVDLWRCAGGKRGI